MQAEYMPCKENKRLLSAFFVHYVQKAMRKQSASENKINSIKLYPY